MTAALRRELPHAHRGDLDVLEDRELVEEPDRLERAGDSRARHTMRLAAGRFVAVHRDRAARGGQAAP